MQSFGVSREFHSHLWNLKYRD